jgi:hypothetical protein
MFAFAAALGVARGGPAYGPQNALWTSDGISWHLEMAVDASKKFITEFNGGVVRQRVYM